MDSVFDFLIDRIYRIILIFEISGFRMKPEIFKPLRGEGKWGGKNLDLSYKASLIPIGGCCFSRFHPKL
jgi:hypothetical protein